MSELYEFRKKAAELGRKMLKSGLTHGTWGNISARVKGEEKIVITPSMMSYEIMQPEDVLVLDFEGNVLEGERNPSIESKMHLDIYKNRFNVGGIVHTHSIYASALAAVGKCIPPFLDELVPQIGGSVDVAEYGMPGSEELARNVVKKLGKKNAVLLANHGALCCGKDMEAAFETAEGLERIAKIYVLSILIGGPKTLPEEVVKLQRQIFELIRT